MGRSNDSLRTPPQIKNEPFWDQKKGGKWVKDVFSASARELTEVLNTHVFSPFCVYFVVLWFCGFVDTLSAPKTLGWARNAQKCARVTNDVAKGPGGEQG